MPSFTHILTLLLFTIAASTATGKEFHVGDAVGWRIPAANESELYTTWASRRRFHIGDSLRFHYNNDSVVLVDKFGFYHCDSSHPEAYYTDGNTLVNLSEVGTVYFISGNVDRCLKGEKMIVNVRNLRHVAPSKAEPPYNPYYAISPSPSQVYGSGPLLDSGPAVSVSASVVAHVVALAGLGLCLLKT